MIIQPFSYFQPIIAAGPAPEAANPVTTGRILQLTAQPSSYAGTGTTWFDQSGNDFDFAIVGSPTWNSTDGFNFNGSSNIYMQLNNTTLNNFFAGVNNQNSLTVFAQHNPTATDTQRMIIQAGNGDILYFKIRIQGNETVNYSIGAPPFVFEYEGDSTGTITNGVSQVTIMNADTNSLRLYTDNVEVPSGVNKPNNTYPTSNNVLWRIGIFTGGDGTSLASRYNGKIKSIVVYNRLLNATERGQVVSWLQSI